MIMLLKKLIFSLMIGTCATAFGMEESNLTKGKESLVSPQRLRVFTSTQEICEYGERLAQAYQNNDYQLVFDLAFPEPSIKFNPTHADFEFYVFNRTSALCWAYRDLAAKNELTPKTAIQYYIEIVKEINKYLHRYGTFKSSIESFNERMLWHRFFIYQDAGRVYSSIGKFKNSLDYDLDKRLAPFKNAQTAYENALHYSDLFFQLPDRLKEQENIRILLPDTQFALLSVYCTLAQLVPYEEAILLLKKARQIQKSASQSQWDTILLKSAVDTIKIAEKIIEGNRLHLAPKGSQRVEALRAQNYHEIQKEALEINNKLNSQINTGMPLKIIIQQKKMKLDYFIKTHQYSDISEELVNGLIDIEKTISEYITLESSSKISITSTNSTTTTSSVLPEEHLKTIYGHLHNLLGGEAIIQDFWKYVSAFIIVGDFNGGIQRAELLKDIEQKQRGTASYLIRGITAGMKNLQGDHEEWLGLEAEFQEKERQKKERQIAAKGKKEQKRAENLRLSLAQQSKKERKILSLPKNTPSIIQNSPKSPEIENVPSAFEETSISYKQRKLEKQKRHEEAELKRQQDVTVSKVNDEEKEPSPDAHIEKTSKETQLELILTSSDKPLSALYNLSSTAFDVDQETEQGTWQFTRDQFKTYAEAMGCIYKSGHGIHTKAALPKAIHIMQGDNLITILNDFGGALTLPSWDKDYVPTYLRTQILEARKKLRALKIKALNYNARG